MSERQFGGLLLDGSHNVRMTMSHARDSGAATHIQVLVPGIVVDIHTGGANSDRIARARIAIEDG